MKPKHQRLIFIAVSVVFLCVATLFALQAFRNNLVFFYSPSELASQAHGPEQLMRLGGLVAAGSIVHEENDRIRFNVTDGKKSVPVTFGGMLPALFREGQGAVAEGYYKNGTFEATRVLTKHDEKYMPKDVVEKLKREGQWRGDGK